jgi:polyisoprenoid-binding protein YceI
MKRILCTLVAAPVLWAGAAWPAAQSPDAQKIDGAHSTMTVHVYKTGLFSALAHNHEIEATIDAGDVSGSGNLSVELHLDARKLRVLDPEVSAETRAEIQRTMQGPQVLDSDRFPEIHFQSTSVEPKGADHWLVQGDLNLHGQTHPVTVDVTLSDGLYRGSASLKQTAFGIKPVTVAGGTVKVKDEVKLEFQIAIMK